MKVTERIKKQTPSHDDATEYQLMQGHTVIAEGSHTECFGQMLHQFKNMTVAGLIFYSVRIAPKSHDRTNVCDFNMGRRYI